MMNDESDETGLTDAEGNVRFLVIAGLLASSLWAQTRVDLKSQSKNIDFSGADSSSPFPVGSILPTNCSVGGMFFKSDAAAGANLYGCVSTNTWAAQAGSGSGGGGSAPSLNLPFAIQKSGNMLTVGSGCTISSPCLVRIGSVTYSILSGATVSAQSGDGTVYFYVDSSGVLSAGTSSSTTPAISCSGCQVVTPMAQFPFDSVPLGTWNVVAGAWDVLGTDSRALLSAAPRFSAGPNVNITQSAGLVTVSASLSTLSTGTLPSCGSDTQGTLWYTPGGTGVKDAVQVCAKDSSNVYAWRTIY
jgi:hypothetical protein